MGYESVRQDCLLYNGVRPCPFDSRCKDCAHYTPVGKQVLVIRARRTGNILRSLPITYAIRKRYGPDTNIAWLVFDDPAEYPRADLVRRAIGVDEVITWTPGNIEMLRARHFAAVICLEADPQEAGLARQISAERYYGYILSDDGTLISASSESDHYVWLGISNQGRFVENTATLEEWLFDMLQVDYEGECARLRTSHEEQVVAKEGIEHEKELSGNPDAPMIAFNVMGNHKVLTRRWPLSYWKELAEILRQEIPGAIINAIGFPYSHGLGRGAVPMWDREISGKMHVPGRRFTLGESIALAPHYDVAISVASMGLHMLTMLHVPTVAIYNTHPHQEVSFYAPHVVVRPDMACSPCYIKDIKKCPYSLRCMDMITPRMVADATHHLLSLREG